ncbi:MAG: hypothetical protein HQ542_09210 [Bacteroidia bacterium]|nr:hypothetical protein [Bacteroidia bacterium]
MKNSKYTLPLLIAFLVVPVAIHARQKEGLKKVIKKEFPVNRDAMLKLSNRFGDVTCTIWDKNEISIEVTISVESTSEKTADKIFSKIDISFRGSDSEVEAVTNLAKNFNAKGNFSIDYKVMMPSSVSLHLINKFGDVMIKELFAKSAIRVEYGKASLGKLNHGDNLLEVAFGSAYVESMKGAVVIVQFSKMRLGYAGSLKLKSKYTDIQAGEVIVLEGTFEGGTIDLDLASVLTIESRFSSFDIGMVKQKINLDMAFGSFEVKGISPEFKSLVIDNEHGSVKIAIPDDLHYTLDAETHFGSIKFPKSRASFSVMSISSNDELYQGTVGTNPTATIKIRNEFGSIKL